MKQISNKKPLRVLKSVKNSRSEFFDFIKEYNVLQLAIGVVIGNAVKDLTNSLVTNVIMPFIGIFTPSGAYKNITFTIRGSDFTIGLLISSIIDFLIVALVVFIVIKKIFRVEIKK